ncbi:MAG: 3-phosphoglycerate dehydrogenase, partial [Coriobacteriia bacterium]|nr:3-phosphoglycerate dehydrogenase [Coriobacteriia bacterium]
LHANVPNMIGQLTAVLAEAHVNIQRMANDAAGENAYTLFDTDEELDEAAIEKLKGIDGMWRVRVIR